MRIWFIVLSLVAVAAPMLADWIGRCSHGRDHASWLVTVNR